MQMDSEKFNRQLIGTVVLVLGLFLPGCQPVAEAAKAKLAVTAKDEAPKADDAMASVMIDSVNYVVDRAVEYRLYDVSGNKKAPIGGSIVTPLVGGGAKGCCIALPPEWRPGQKVRVEWEESDRKETFPEHYIRELEIPRYEKPADLYVVFYPEHEIEVVVSVAEPGHPEWAGRIKQSPWNQCVADFGRKVCKRATPKLFDTASAQGFCVYLKEEARPDGQRLCDSAMSRCMQDFEDEDYCKSILWGPLRNEDEIMGVRPK